jgi:hypothetical protein
LPTGLQGQRHSPLGPITASSAPFAKNAGKAAEATHMTEPLKQIATFSLPLPRPSFCWASSDVYENSKHIAIKVIYNCFIKISYKIVKEYN